MNRTAKLIIRKLKLKKHIEGGYFSETYRSKDCLGKSNLPARYKGKRNLSTAIYFLLCGNELSAVHRLKTDEIWHYYSGSPLKLYAYKKDKVKIIKLGSNISRGEIFQALVPAGTWLSAEVSTKNSYTLVGCTLSPGFDFADFELGKKKNLIKLFPKHISLIERMTIK